LVDESENLDLALAYIIMLRLEFHLRIDFILNVFKKSMKHSMKIYLFHVGSEHEIL
jgi:hypothetical protein